MTGLLQCLYLTWGNETWEADDVCAHHVIYRHTVDSPGPSLAETLHEGRGNLPKGASEGDAISPREIPRPYHLSL